MAKSSILLVLLHNNNKNRLKIIRPKIKILKRNLSQKYLINYQEIFEQPILSPSSFSLTLFRRYIYWIVNRQWEAYKLYKPRMILFDLLFLLRRLIIVFTDPQRECLKAKAEILSSSKHVQAWNMLINKNMKYLICFEDDAVFKKDSLKKVQDSLLEISNTSNPVVINFGAGNPPEINKVEKLESKKTSEKVYYKKPVLNTACCYLIDIKTAKIFQNFIMENPLYTILAGDWLMNKIFINSTPKTKYFCFHPLPPVFDHGSLNGKFKSEISS